MARLQILYLLLRLENRSNSNNTQYNIKKLASGDEISLPAAE